MARTPEQNNAIITGNIPRQLLLFFFPIWLGTMFQQLYNTVDSIVVGLLPKALARGTTMK